MSVICKLLAQLLEDIRVLTEVHSPSSIPSTLDKSLHEEETHSLIAKRILRIETAQDYTSETYLRLLLHMFDVPRKIFKFTRHMQKDWDDITKREKIEDFYPPEHNFYIQLYTDPDNRRDLFQSEQNIQQLLRDAFYSLKDRLHGT